jgi:hypothetical protein
VGYDWCLVYILEGYFDLSSRSNLTGTLFRNGGRKALSYWDGKFDDDDLFEG